MCLLLRTRSIAMSVVPAGTPLRIRREQKHSWTFFLFLSGRRDRERAFAFQLQLTRLVTGRRFSGFFLVLYFPGLLSSVLDDPQTVFVGESKSSVLTSSVYQTCANNRLTVPRIFFVTVDARAKLPTDCLACGTFKLVTRTLIMFFLVFL